jgi:hypothetical protein
MTAGGVNAFFSVGGHRPPLQAEWVVGQFEIFLVAALVRAWSFHRFTAAATMSIPYNFAKISN